MFRPPEPDPDVGCAAAAGRFEPDRGIFENEGFARGDPFAPHGLQETVGVGLAARDVESGQNAVDRTFGGGFARPPDAQVAHDPFDVFAAARRDDPHAAALRAELPAELPQGAVEGHGVEIGGVEGDLELSDPFAPGRIADTAGAQEFVAPHAEVAGCVLLLAEREPLAGERLDVGERVGAARVGQRAVEIQQDQSYR